MCKIEYFMIGRKIELKHLDSLYASKDAKICVIYGRRRIGKSYLIKHWCHHKQAIYIEGIEGQHSHYQINIFKEQLATFLKEPRLMKIQFKDWKALLDEFTECLKTEKLKKTKTILILDEIQWLAAGQSKLISLLKHYWDTHWSQLNFMLIICGSVASYVVEKVIKSKALYGRISSQLLLTELPPNESAMLLNKRGQDEVLKYLMLLGGVPKYLIEINQKKSFNENIAELCFKQTGFFYNEMEKIFYSQFREAKTYSKIVEALADRPLSLGEICKKLKVPSSGGIKNYVSILEMARLIRSYTPVNQTSNKYKRYKLFDEFLIFYFKFIKPSQNLISESTNINIFKSRVLPIWRPWLGIAFERFCHKNAFHLATCAGFQNEILAFGPYVPSLTIGAQATEITSTFS